MKFYLRWFYPIAALIGIFFLASCQGTPPATAAQTIQAASPSPALVASSTPLPTMPPIPTETIQAAVKVPRATPLLIPDGLVVDEYLLKEPPEAEAPLDFAQADPHSLHDNERAKIFPDLHCTGKILSMCANLGKHQLIAQEIYTNDGSSGLVILRQDGKEIYQIAIGPGSPIEALRGLWVYDDHWVLETAKITETQQGNSVTDNAVGRVSVDGQLLNDSRGYEEAFGFQTLNGRPFYFFKKQAKIGASYDGVEIPLDYDQVPHYGCCSASELNPHRYQDMVDFLAFRDGNWYYVEIGLYK